MNSKEALKRLKQETAPATYMPDFDKDKCIEIIKQDLDKLEQLEKKYQKLEETYKKRAELCSEFAEYTRQYEKVLDFLMDKFKLELKGNKLYFLYNNQYFELDKEEEKLMKEAFGYEE